MVRGKLEDYAPQTPVIVRSSLHRMAPQTPLPSTLGPQGTMTEVHVSEVTSPSAFHVNLASRRYPE